MDAIALPTRKPTAFVLALLHGMSDPSTERDAELVRLLAAAAAGDGRAFESFYDATARLTLAVVRRIAGDALAEDIVADTYFQAWRCANRFDAGRGSALTCLLTMARSRALDRVRQEQLRHGGLTGAPDHCPDDTVDGGVVGPDALLESLQAQSRLHEALAELSAGERWVLGLAYFRDLSQSEIAAVTAMPLGTVKSLMTRAQHKLRGALQDG
jgi:RNA polymerase sigma factor (sigma-70 family)